MCVYLIHSLLSLGRSETVKNGSRHAKPIVELFELCDLLRMFRLVKSAESFKPLKDRKGDFLTKLSRPLPNLALARLEPFLTVSDRPRAIIV